MAATELAKAYVQIIPTTKGIKGKLGEELGDEVEDAGKKSGKKGGESAGVSFAKKMLKIVAAAKIGEKVVEGIKASVQAGAALEQSIGGIETLFKESSDTMIQYANNAFKTCGWPGTLPAATRPAVGRRSGLSASGPAWGCSL